VQQIILIPMGNRLRSMQTNGKIQFPIKMSARSFEGFLMQQNFPPDKQFTREELRCYHHSCCLRNFALAPSNPNMWQSAIYVFYFLLKASENVLNLSIQLQNCELKDVAEALILVANY
jgi:hypothetical protein